MTNRIQRMNDIEFFGKGEIVPNIKIESKFHCTEKEALDQISEAVDYYFKTTKHANSCTVSFKNHENLLPVKTKKPMEKCKFYVLNDKKNYIDLNYIKSCFTLED